MGLGQTAIKRPSLQLGQFKFLGFSSDATDVVPGELFDLNERLRDSEKPGSGSFHLALASFPHRLGERGLPARW